MPLLDEALTFLLANTTGFRNPVTASTDIPIYLNTMPTTPDTAMALYEPGGAPPLVSLNSTVPVSERPRLQLMSRAPGYEAARDNAQSIWDALFGLTNTDIAKTGSTGVTTWQSADPVGSPGDLGLDGNNRNLVSANFQLTKEMS